MYPKQQVLLPLLRGLEMNHHQEMCLMSDLILGLEAEGAGGGRLAGISGLKKGFTVIVMFLYSRFSWEDRMTQQEEWGVQQVSLF